MVRDEARVHCKAASQGPNGIGGRFNDEQLEEIITRVYDKLNEIAKSLTGKDMNMRSYLPQDREHPNTWIWNRVKCLPRKRYSPNA